MIGCRSGRGKKQGVLPAVFFSLGVLLCARSAWPEAGLTAAPILLRPFSARAVGMGGAFAAVAGGIDSLGYNPAGTAFLRRTDVETAYTSGVFGDNFGFIGGARPVAHRAVVSAGYLYDNAGTIDLNLSNGTKGNVTAEEDMVGLLGVSIPLGGGLAVGAVGKYLHLTLAQQATATDFAADAGVLWRTPLAGLSLGAALQNLGPEVKFEQAGDPLPTLERGGFSYYLPQKEIGMSGSMFSMIRGYTFSADAVKIKDETLSEALGVEIESRMVDLRLGYQVDNPPQSLSFGFGVRERGFRFDYALNLTDNNLGDVHHFSLGYRF